MNPTRYLRSAAVIALFAVGFVSAPATASSASASTHADLNVVTEALERTVDTPGTAWGVDRRARQVVVSHDDTVTGAELIELTSIAERFPAAVRIERVRGAIGTHISGGDGIFGGGTRCTLGFNVASGTGAQYFLTAGHCTDISSSWYAADQTTYLGPTAGSSFPGNDFGIVRYASGVSRPGNVNLHNGSYRDITGAGTARVGDRVCLSSPIGGFRCGYVVALNVTVNYPQGTVSGLGRIDICSAPGDSGAPVFRGTVAVGLVSGGSGNCSSGGTTFFQPVTEPLSIYGVHVY
ncbi:MAG: S1 family peptidase [Micromonosporaceae bacterium]